MPSEGWRAIGDYQSILTHPARSGSVPELVVDAVHLKKLFCKMTSVILNEPAGYPVYRRRRPDHGQGDCECGWYRQKNENKKHHRMIENLGLFRMKLSNRGFFGSLSEKSTSTGHHLLPMRKTRASYPSGGVHRGRR